MAQVSPSLKHCPHCKAVNAPLAPFCVGCGRAFVLQMYIAWVRVRHDMQTTAAAMRDTLKVPTFGDEPTGPITDKERALHQNRLNEIADTERSMASSAASLQSTNPDARDTANKVADAFRNASATEREAENRRWERRRIEAGEITASSPDPQ